MSDEQQKDAIGTVAEYLTALRASPRFGPQVVTVREIPGQEARYAPLASPMPQSLSALAPPLQSLYSHQAEAIDLLRANESVIVATPTASGKSCIYNAPVIEHLLQNPTHHALYLFPLKALAQDQLRTFEELVAPLPVKKRPQAAIYDGDTSGYRRKKIRELLPHVIFSNPDILHLSLLGYHEQWGTFWSRLSHVVIDEVHIYRGVFGSHMAWVLRRLRRICRQYGNEPVFILSSATVSNPAQLALDLLGVPAAAVIDSGAPQNRRTFVFFDPSDSPAYAASQLLEAALKRGLRTIVYTQSRKMTELIAMWTSARLGENRGKLAAYRAGFLPEERRLLEAKLASGELLGVVSTSALELGIDIGELELCILVGYPGSIMATWQRSGRVGRRGHDSLVVLVAQEDALDKHFMRHPDDFFERAVEPAVLNPDNEKIVRQHLLCAAAESPLAAADPLLKGAAARAALEALAMTGELLQGEDGAYWYSSRKYPQRTVDLRGSGQSFAIRLQQSGELLGEVDGLRCLKECHPGAVYLQQGRTLLVLDLDLERCQVMVDEKKVHYFTRALSFKETEILQTMQSRELSGFLVSYGSLRVTDRVTGYQRRLVKGHKLINTHSLDLPPSIFETEGLWLHIPAEIQREMEARQLHFMGAIHAVEHAAIGVFPLLVLCDRNDVGGISIPYHPQIGGAAIFIYDGHAGGIGLSRQAYHQAADLLEVTYKAIAECKCETGCPSCVHSPKCGSGNRPIDKEAARILLELLLGKGKGERGKEKGKRAEGGQKGGRWQGAVARGSEVKELGDLDGARPRSREIVLPVHYAVFDLETKRSAAEVGGWHRAERMGISVVVVYDSKEDAYFSYQEDEIDGLVAHLQAVDLVVGFNNKRFDNLVLSAYTTFALHTLPTLDILEVVKNRLGYRLSLDRLAETTLGVRKSANGLQALQWYKEGKMKEIVEYCRQDVEITRDLLLYGIEKGYLLFCNKAGTVVRCPFKIEDKKGTGTKVKG